MCSTSQISSVGWFTGQTGIEALAAASWALLIWALSTQRSPDSIENCVTKSGKKPIPSGWVDVNKGDADSPIIRSRWVIKETRSKTTMDTSDRSQTYSATPPYEALRMLCSIHMSPCCEAEKLYVLDFLDISRAHPHARTQRDIWTELPAEDPRAGDGVTCGYLLANVNGTRDAGLNFELFTLEVMEQLGFEAGVWSPCIFKSEQRNSQAYAYGWQAFGKAGVHVVS